MKAFLSVRSIGRCRLVQLTLVVAGPDDGLATFKVERPDGTKETFFTRDANVAKEAHAVMTAIESHYEEYVGVRREVYREIVYPWIN